MRSYLLRIKLIVFLLFSQILLAQKAPYSYSYIPKFVYKNQIFPITILVKHYNINNPPNFEFDIMSLTQPITPEPVKTINKQSAFFTFYFKAKSENNLQIPTLTIWDLNLTYILNPKTIPIKKLEVNNRYFSNVIASNLRVNKVKIDPYDSKNNLITLYLEAVEANLEDMHIKGVKDDGIENIKRNGANIRANYYFIINSNKKYIIFSYYNSMKKKFIEKKISLNSFKNRIESSNLNPKDTNFNKIKKYTLVTLFIIFILFFFITKERLYLFIIIILLIILVYLFLPRKKICINEGSSLYILPTQNSNISLQIEEQIKREVLKEYNNYYKILYKENITGWVKNEDLCKD